MNPMERWAKIGKPSEEARIERLKEGFVSEDTDWLSSHEAMEDEARRENEHPNVRGYFCSTASVKDKAASPGSVFLAQ